ncbi:hypothetical protein HYW74_03145 [Candidatus Pacearchaeota archaeon]|nr:hypothetical protein [Candidatus Pacearchaeota archaeon]
MTQRQDDFPHEYIYSHALVSHLSDGSFEFPDFFSKIHGERNRNIGISFMGYQGLDDSGVFNVLKLYDHSAYVSIKEHSSDEDRFLGFFITSKDGRLLFPKNTLGEVLEKLSLKREDKVILRGFNDIIELWSPKDFEKVHGDIATHYQNNQTHLIIY